MNNNAESVCSYQYGNLNWAVEQCNNDINCKWLHSYDCKDYYWSFCSNVDINVHKGQGGCSKLKPGNKSNTVTYHIIFYSIRIRRDIVA